ncbi:MAG: F0F1 ATP synthase subunit epsilon [Candidatus Aminicenantes bacterium]|nr:F0F1 ATP synthase subunit epsilon [Candidatus Aminicenantes bacterium]
MAETIELEIISFREVFLRSEIKDLYIPAFWGEAGVKSNHLPYLSQLKPGEISYLDMAGVRHYLYSGEGFLEVRDNHITLIIDTIERGEDFNAEELKKKLAASDDRVKSSFQGAITPLELKEELARQKELRLKLDICKKSAKK